MRRKKGSFRNGNKKGARSNLHNFRSSSQGITWNDQIAAEVAEKVAEKVEATIEVVVPPVAKKRGRPKKVK